MKLKEIQAVHVKIADYIRRHPEKTFAVISTELGLSNPMISKIARKHGIFRRSGNRYAIDGDLMKKLEQ